jgi:hypothetical protein
MVDRLKRALEEIEPPICPSCYVEMKWSRSTLVGTEVISHVFLCPNCHKIGEATSKVIRNAVLPDKLMAPAHKSAA